MSNDITTNPIVIDTASATALTTKQFVAYMIRWVGATTAGHTAIVQNAAGKVLWASEASGANYVEETHFVGGAYQSPLLCTGLIVPTLGSGTVYIYISSEVPIRT